jgi:hypothetical protein
MLATVRRMTLYQAILQKHHILILLRQLHSLRHGSNSRIDRKAFLIQPGEIFPQRREREAEAFNILILLELRLRPLIPRILHIDIHEHHTSVRVTEAGIIPHDEPAVLALIRRKRSNIAGLLLQFSQRALRDRLPFIDQAGRHLDRDSVEGWAELFLQEERGPVLRVPEDGDHADAVAFAVLGPCLVGYKDSKR